MTEQEISELDDVRLFKAYNDIVVIPLGKQPIAWSKLATPHLDDIEDILPDGWWWELSAIGPDCVVTVRRGDNKARSTSSYHRTPSVALLRAAIKLAQMT